MPLDILASAEAPLQQQQQHHLLKSTTCAHLTTLRRIPRDSPPPCPTSNQATRLEHQGEPPTCQVRSLPHTQWWGLSPERPPEATPPCLPGAHTPVHAASCPTSPSKERDAWPHDCPLSSELYENQSWHCSKLMGGQTVPVGNPRSSPKREHVGLHSNNGNRLIRNLQLASS